MVERSGVCGAPPDVAPGSAMSRCSPPGGATGAGDDAAGAYRRYVEAGLTDPPCSPFRETFGGWVLGSSGFVERLRALAGPIASDPPLPEARQPAGLDAGVVLAAGGGVLRPGCRRADPAP